MDVSSLKRVQAWLNNKLGNAEWPSASSILDHLPDALKLWEAGDLDAIVKVRLCICCAMLSRKRREESASLLGELAVAARSDADEWVRVIGCAVGNFNGTMDLNAVRDSSQAVDESYQSLWSLLEGSQEDRNPAPAPLALQLDAFSPLAEQYMHPELRELRGDEGGKQQGSDLVHFVPREESRAGLDFSLESLMSGGLLQGKKPTTKQVATTSNQQNSNIFIPVAITRSGRDGSGLLKQPSVDYSVGGTPRGSLPAALANKRLRVEGPEGGGKTSSNTEII